MVTVKPTEDMMTVKAIIALPEIWNEAADSGMEVADFFPENNTTSQWLIVYEKDQVIGSILLQTESTVKLRFHPYLIKNFRHLGREMMAQLYKLVLSLESINKLVATIPDCNRKLVNFSKKVGMKSEGFSPESIEKDGALYGERFLGITRQQMRDWIDG